MTERLNLFTDDRFERKLEQFGVDPTSIQAMQLQERLRRDVDRDLYEIAGRTVDRDSVMSLIIDLVALGQPLAKVAKIPGMPNLRTILYWRKIHPLFEEEMRLAEEAAAYELVEDAREVLDGTDKNMAFADMNKAKYRQWLAAKYNHRFVEKTKIEDDTPLERRSREELVEMVALSIHAADPETKTVLMARLRKEGVITQQQEVDHE